MKWQKKESENLEITEFENIYSEEQKEKRIDIINSFRDPWDFIKHNKVEIRSAAEEEEEKKGTDRIFDEIKTPNLLNWMEKINLFFQIA